MEGGRERGEGGGGEGEGGGRVALRHFESGLWGLRFRVCS